MPDNATFNAFLTADTITKILIIIMLSILAAIVLGPRVLALLGRKQDVDDKKAMADLEARASERKEREAQTQAINALIGEMVKSNSVLVALVANQNEQFHNNAEMLKTMQDWQTQEDKRMDMRKQIHDADLASADARFGAIADEMKQYTHGVQELSGNITDKWAEEAQKDRQFYTTKLDERMAEITKHIEDLKQLATQLQSDINAIKEATSKKLIASEPPAPIPVPGNPIVIPPPTPEVSPVPPVAAQ